MQEFRKLFECVSYLRIWTNPITQLDLLLNSSTVPCHNSTSVVQEKIVIQSSLFRRQMSIKGVVQHHAASSG
jgi:hypothetical protein